MADTSYPFTEYREVAILNADHGISIVQARGNGKIYVKKELQTYDTDVYEQLFIHPVRNLPQIYDLREIDGILYLIEEYISGETLQDILDRGGVITEQDAIGYAIALCNILTELHSQNPPIIHRDIKPSNVMLSEDGRIVLLDLNAARLSKEQGERDTRLIGTAGFAAPEQYGFGTSSERTDIYATGKLLSALLRQDEDHAPVLSPALSGIISKCLELNPRDRFATAKDLAAALENCKLCQTIGGSPDKPVISAKKRAIIAGICLVIAMAMAAGIICLHMIWNTLGNRPGWGPGSGSMSISTENIGTDKDSDGDMDFDANVNPDTDMDSGVNEESVHDSESVSNENEDYSPDETYGAGSSAASREDVIKDIPGVYSGNDYEALVIDEDGYAYYFCNDFEYSDLHCVWYIEDDRIHILLDRLHCDIYSDISDRNLIFKSDSINWDTEKFTRIDVEPEQYFTRKLSTHDPDATQNIDGTITYSLDDITYTIPKTYADLPDYFDKMSNVSAFMESDPHNSYSSTILFSLDSSADMRSDPEKYAQDFVSGFYEDISIEFKKNTTVAGNSATIYEFNGYLNDGFMGLSGYAVSGLVVLFENKSSSNTDAVMFMQNSARSYDNTEVFMNMLEQAK